MHPVAQTALVAVQDASASPTVTILAERLNDGTSSNWVGNSVAALATIFAVVVAGFGAYFMLMEFIKSKGKIKQAAPEILGIAAAVILAAVLILKIPELLGFGNTFLSDFLPF